jgi:hypothetical protein
VEPSASPPTLFLPEATFACKDTKPVSMARSRETKRHQGGTDALPE